MNFKANKKNILIIVVCVVFSLCAAIYYYGLHLNFWPDAEHCMTLLRYYYAEIENTSFSSLKEFWLTKWLSEMAYRLFGINYHSMRIYVSSVYFFCILPTTILSLYSFRKKCFKWYLIPLLTFVAVIINPGRSEFCGFMSEIYHVYPYDMHASAVLLTLLSVMVLQIYLWSEQRKKKIVSLIILVGLILVGCRQADFLLYMTGFVLPLCIWLIAWVWRKHRQIFMYLVLAVSGALVIARICSLFMTPLQLLFAGNITVYGQANFIMPGDVWNSLINVVTEIGALYNINIAGESILSVYTLIAFLRIGIVCIIFYIAFRYVVLIFRSGGETIDCISAVASCGILLNIFFLVISTRGFYYGARSIRYMTMVLFFGALLLCRNADIIFASFMKMKNAKNFLFLFWGLCVLLDVRPVWKGGEDRILYEKAIEEVTNIIVDNGLGNGYGGHWYGPNMTLLMDGEYAVVEEDRIVNNIQINYIVNGKKGSALPGIESGHYRAYEESALLEQYGKPDRVWETEFFYIWYYNEGIV